MPIQNPKSGPQNLTLGVLPEQGGSIANLRRSGQDTRFIEQYLGRYMREFDAVHYFSYAREGLDAPVGENFHLHSNPGVHRWFYAFVLPLVHRRSLRRCSVLRVMQATGAVPAYLARRFFGVPFVTTYGYHYGHHAAAEAGLRARRLRAWLFDRRARWALRRADGIIVTTPALAEFVRQFAPADRIAVIPNSVDTDRFAPTPRAQREPSRRPRLIAVGQLAPRKNHRLMLEAVARTGRKDIEVVIVGTGPEDDALRRLATEKGISLELPGIISNEDMPAQLQRADMYMITSSREGHPKSLLEAMSVGLACIGTDVPGIRNVLRDGETGWLCPADPGALAAAAGSVLSDPAAAGAMGDAARRFILENYEAGAIMAREVAFLKEIALRSRRNKTF